MDTLKWRKHPFVFYVIAPFVFPLSLSLHQRWWLGCGCMDGLRHNDPIQTSLGMLDSVRPCALIFLWLQSSFLIMAKWLCVLIDDRHNENKFIYHWTIYKLNISLSLHSLSLSVICGLIRIFISILARKNY